MHQKSEESEIRKLPDGYFQFRKLFLSNILHNSLQPMRHNWIPNFWGDEIVLRKAVDLVESIFQVWSVRYEHFPEQLKNYRDHIRGRGRYGSESLSKWKNVTHQWPPTRAYVAGWGSRQETYVVKCISCISISFFVMVNFFKCSRLYSSWSESNKGKQCWLHNSLFRCSLSHDTTRSGDRKILTIERVRGNSKPIEQNRQHSTDDILRWIRSRHAQTD